MMGSAGVRSCSSRACFFLTYTLRAPLEPNSLRLLQLQLEEWAGSRSHSRLRISGRWAERRVKIGIKICVNYTFAILRFSTAYGNILNIFKTALLQWRNKLFVIKMQKAMYSAGPPQTKDFGAKSWFLANMTINKKK